ncbi:hypothetical protein GCM10010249_15890 [Streptomyces roseolilacinus]|uniref:Uncharacterized protein n=1 Tax=Streptomyces roseolilacinus TaxID=66904 RepID=A0A918AXQ3_9ACTN|nr:hypothetical protein GCM10010249_15890 [Streptomyces roseolilacinus]
MGQGGHQVAEGLAGAGAGLDEQVRTVVDGLGDGLGHGGLAWPFHAADGGDGGMEELGEGWLRHSPSTLRRRTDSRTTAHGFPTPFRPLPRRSRPGQRSPLTRTGDPGRLPVTPG